MANILSDIKNTYPYEDDIIIATITLEERHIESIQLIFERLRQYKIHLKPQKCLLTMPSI